MIIDITGSTGFVGSNFIKQSPEFEIREVDLLKYSIDEIKFSGADSVLHLAALVHQMKGAPEEEYFRVNRDLAIKTALRAKKQGVAHFILMSTAKVYGESSGNILPFNELSECNPIGPYAKSKLEAEKLVMNLEDKKFKVAIIRSPLVYGHGVRANMLNLVRMVDKFPVLPFKGINNLRSIVYVGNLVALMRCIIEKRASGIYIAGDHYPLSTEKMVELIVDSFNKKRILFRIPKSGLAILNAIKPDFYQRLFGSFVLDNNSTNNSLGFMPPFSSAKGIQEMVEWYKEGIVKS